MQKSEILNGLNELAKAGVGGRIVIIGSAAAILCDWLERATEDIDVIASDVKLSRLKKSIEIVAEKLDLPSSWLNDAAVAWGEILPSDFMDRTNHFGHFHDLEVIGVGRPDFILLKLYAFRPQDFEDLKEIKPTEEEIEFVRGHLPRIAGIDQGKAMRIELYLEQGKD